MSVQLQHMNLDEAKEYRAYAIQEWANDNARFGIWPRDDSMQMAEECFDSMLPPVDLCGVENIPNNDITSPFGNNQNLLWAVNDKQERVGFVWIDIGEYDRAEICDFEIYAPFRRRGYGRQLLEASKQFIVEGWPQTTQIRLSVHTANKAAKTLYEKGGFEERKVYMYMDV